MSQDCIATISHCCVALLYGFIIISKIRSLKLLFEVWQLLLLPHGDIVHRQLPLIFAAMITKEVLALAQKLWDYHHIDNRLEVSDCILVLGSHDVRVADRGAELYLEGWSPLLIFSGGLGRLTEDMWTETEADKFAAIAIRKGVPAEAILIENKSTNTGENILFTQQLLARHNLNPQSFIVVQKPYMERRSYATFKKLWPNKTLIVTSPQISFKDYPTADITIEKVIHIMAGDFQRIKVYAEKGFQIYQPLPDDVWQAYEKLVELGFDEHLIK